MSWQKSAGEISQKPRAETWLSSVGPRAWTNFLQRRSRFATTGKGNQRPKPEDVKKRTDLRAQAVKKFDEAIPYFEKVEQDLGSKGKLKMQEKQALKDAYDLLITIYETKM